MSAAKHSHPTSSWKLTGSWAGAWKTFAGVGVVGLAAAGFGYTQDARRFAFSWMFAFATCLTVSLGALFFVLVQRLTSAGWSVTVRRTAEFFASGIWVFAPLFIPVLMTMGHLFPWLGEHHESHEKSGAAEHGSISLIRPAYAQETAAQPAGEGNAAPAGDPHAAPPAGGHAAAPGEGGPSMHGLPAPHHFGQRPGPHTLPGSAGATGVHGVPPGMPDPHAVIEHEIMEKKSGYLNRNFFLGRAAAYFVIWVFLALRLFGYSTAQDSSKDPNLTISAQRFAAPATFLFALSLTFAAFDWIMSLEPSWFSTIFGVVIFATAAVSSYAVLILTTMALKNAGPLEGAVTVEHYHDLGKLMWGFLVFWAYVSFSQLMLIWYAALPEETTFFHNRWDYAPWKDVSTLIILGHFVIPFFWLISRNFKRNLGRLQIGAAIILVMHVVDIYWYVMPNYHLGKDGFSFHWMDSACLLGVAGVYGAAVFYRMTQHPLVPVGDPRLERSLHFQNA